MNQIDPENDASTGGQVKRNKNVTGETLDWTSNTEEGSNEESSPMNHTGLHDDPSNSDDVETNKAFTGGTGTLHEPSNDEEGSSEENTSQLPVDATSPSPEENKTKHSVATALDGTRLMCAQCGEKQEVKLDQIHFTVNPIIQ